jgi:hypothetical protein
MLVVGGCSQSRFGGEATVAEAVRNIHRWDGKIFVVHGWLGNCGELDCGMYSTKADAELVASAGTGWQQAMERRLSIGSMADFNVHAKPLQFQRVKVTALIDDFCRSWGNGCTDRAPELIPFSIEADQTKPKGK